MNRIIVQLVINGQAVWQTLADDIPDDHCRRMTREELAEIGKAAAAALAGIVTGSAIHITPTSVQASPAAAPASSKRRR